MNFLFAGPDARLFFSTSVDSSCPLDLSNVQRTRSQREDELRCSLAKWLCNYCLLTQIIELSWISEKRIWLCIVLGAALVVGNHLRDSWIAVLFCVLISFVNASWVCGQLYSWDGLAASPLCSQGYLWVLICRPRKGGQLIWPSYIWIRSFRHCTRPGFALIRHWKDRVGCAS